jgi:hypothetical protein
MSSGDKDIAELCDFESTRLVILVGSTKALWDLGRCTVADPDTDMTGFSGPPGAAMVVIAEPRGNASVWISEIRIPALSASVWPAIEAVIAQGLFSIPRVSIDACSNMGGYPSRWSLDIRPVLFYLDSMPMRFVPERNPAAAISRRHKRLAADRLSLRAD